MFQTVSKKRFFTRIGVTLGIVACIGVSVGLALISFPFWIAAVAIGAIGTLGLAGYVGYQYYRQTPTCEEPAIIQADQPQPIIPVTNTMSNTPSPTTLEQNLHVPAHAPLRINPCMLQAQLQVNHLEIRSVLGLPQEATKKECIERCRKQLLYWHPDKNVDIKTECSLPISDPRQQQVRLCVDFWIRVYQQVSQWDPTEGACVIALPSKMMQQPTEEFWQSIIRRYDTLQKDFDAIRRDQDKIARDQERIAKQQEHIANGIERLRVETHYDKWMDAWDKRECEQHRASQYRFSLFFEPKTTYAEIKQAVSQWSLKKAALRLIHKTEKPTIVDPVHFENRRRFSLFCQTHNLTQPNRYTTEKPCRPTNPEMMQRLSF